MVTAIIDYGAGNIHSIEKALEYVGATVQVTDDQMWLPKQKQLCFLVSVRAELLWHV
jgi:glutamine amidotransferase